MNRISKAIGRLQCALGFHTPGLTVVRYSDLFETVYCGRNCGGVYQDDRYGPWDQAGDTDAAEAANARDYSI